MKLVIDTDAGIDDAAAIVWLFCQHDVSVEILGITTVVGNTTVENVTNNVLTLLDAFEMPNVPIAMGASCPLVRHLGMASALLHGPDGLWFVGSENPHDLSALSKDVPAFYQRLARDHPGEKILALGPLTNIAMAIQRFPVEMAQFSEIIILGGSKKATAPFDDFNLWADPEAAQIVLTSGLAITMVTVEAQEQFVLNQADLEHLACYGSRPTQFIVKPMTTFLETLSGFSELKECTFADVVGAMVALEPEVVKSAKRALVRIDTGEGLARGQTYIGDNLSDRFLLAVSEDVLDDWAYRAFSDPNFEIETEVLTALALQPENALVITEVDRDRMKAMFMNALGVGGMNL